MRLLRAADDDAPDLGPLLEVFPGELAGVLGLELIPQRLGIVVISQLEGLAGAQCRIPVEDLRMALAGRDLANIDNSNDGHAQLVSFRGVGSRGLRARCCDVLISHVIVNNQSSAGRWLRPVPDRRAESPCPTRMNLAVRAVVRSWTHSAARTLRSASRSRIAATCDAGTACRLTECLGYRGRRWPIDSELLHLARVFVALGVTDIRVTGGEPLVRPGITEIVRELRSMQGLREISMTTNGVLLEEHIDALVDAGLDRVNVSVDSLDPQRFAQVTRRRDLHRVLAGLAACERNPKLGPVKVNAVVLRGVSEADVLPLARLARERAFVVRFIETMPLDADRSWCVDQVIPGAELRRIITEQWPLREQPRTRPSAPGTRWRFVDGRGELEFVSSVTEPFCSTCDRLRLTADGLLRTCLFAEEETDLLGPLRAGATDDELAALICTAVRAKGAGHGIGRPGWAYSGRPMSRIGG